MLLICIYLYLNKPNMCAWTLLSDSVNSAQNINLKWLQSSPFIGIFKDIAITLKLASGILLCAHIYMTDPFPQIIMHLSWLYSVIHKEKQQNHQQKNNPAKSGSLQSISVSGVPKFSRILISPYNT